MWTSAPAGTMDVASTISPPITLTMSASTVVVACTFILETADIGVVVLGFAGVEVVGLSESPVPHATASNNNKVPGRKEYRARSKLAFI